MIEPVATTVRMLPAVINLKSNRPLLIGRIEFAGEAKPILEQNQPMLLLFGEVEVKSERQMFVYSEEELKWYLVGFFDSTVVIESVTSGAEVEMTLVSRMANGQWVYGRSYVTIK